MQISALGPLTIDGRPVAGSRLAALVLPLLLAHGRIVGAADLVEAVWEGAPPADPAGALQALVSRARRLTLTVTAVGGGYRIDPQGLDVDALVAQDLLGLARAAAADDPVRAAELSARGLALWPAGDAARAGGRFGRTYLDLLAIRVEALLARSEPLDGGLLDLLRDAVGKHPLDEHLTALLMRALAATARDTEALEVYDRLRAMLVETFGTDPSAVVARTHLALLRGELAAPARPDVAIVRSRWRRPTTAMVGRDADLATLEQELAGHVLVTLIAVGGAGKTRLAVEVARRASDRGEAVHALELASLRDGAEILPALLSALGAAESTTDPDDPLARRVLDPRERMLHAVAALDGLLVLDNCEHLLAAVADVTAQVLAAAGPGLRVLATSRAPLGVVGELVHTVDTLPDDAALDLLAARGRAARPGLGWDPEVARTLCHRLDNLPLALELAAARLRSMPLADVLAGIDHRFALLDNALRGLPDRHAGLWAMVDWSWALLDPAARVLLRDLAVVPAPFTADLARALADDSAGAAAGLASLVEQSLLTLEESGHGPARYRMLETVREYGEARFAADDAVDARDAVMARLAGWAARRARALREGYIGPSQLEQLEATTLDHDTLVSALRWAVDRGREREAFAIGAALLTVWTMRGLHLEVVSWARQLLHADFPERRRASWDRLRSGSPGRAVAGPGDEPGGAPDADDVAATAAITTVNAGIANDLRAAVLAGRLTRWAVADRGDQLTRRTAGLARMANGTVSTDHAVHLAAAEALLAEPDVYLHGVGLLLRAALRENYGDTVESNQDARAAYAFFESVGDHWGMGTAAQAVSQLDATHDGVQAEEWLLRAIDHLELVGAVQDARTLLVHLDLRRALSGSTEAAVGLARTAGSTASSFLERAHASMGLAVLAAREARWEDAVMHADAAVHTARQITTVAPQGRIVTEVAAAIVRIRAGRDGAGLLAVAARAAFAISDMPVLGSVALGYGELAAADGDAGRADELWAVGVRLGANLALMLGAGPDALITLDSAAGSPRTAALERARAFSVADAMSRVATLIDG